MEGEVEYSTDGELKLSVELGKDTVGLEVELEEQRVVVVTTEREHQRKTFRITLDVEAVL